MHASGMEQTEEVLQNTEDVGGDVLQEPENKDKSVETTDSSTTSNAETVEEKATADTYEGGQPEVTQETIETAPNTEEAIKGSPDNSDVNNQVMNQTGISTQSGIGIGLLNDAKLTAEHESTGEKETIRLSFEGNGLLDIKLLSSPYVIFSLPSEIAAAINPVIEPGELSASYDVPFLIFRNKNKFKDEEIRIEGNKVILNLKNVSMINLLSNFEFTLEIVLDELPPTKSGEYVFYAQVVDKPLVNISLLDMSNEAKASMDAPPEAPVLHDPVYTSHITVTGTGEANARVILTINGIEYSNQIDKDGNFSVAIPRQKSGTIIQAAVVNKRGHQSEETSVTVEEPPDTIPPDAPTVEQVYSKDTVVSGTGEEGTRVVLTVGDSEGIEGVVDSEGNFSVPISAQKSGTVITAILIDEAGNKSEATKVTVKEAMLSFHTVPDTLLFEPITIGSELVTAQRQDPDWSIEVMDTRGEGSNWTLTVRAEQLLVSTSDSSRTLPNPLVYIDELNNIKRLKDGSVEVFSGTTGTDPITAVKWKANQGPLVRITPTHAYAETYSTTINWELVDAP